MNRRSILFFALVGKTPRKQICPYVFHPCPTVEAAVRAVFLQSIWFPALPPPACVEYSTKHPPTNTLDESECRLWR